ncbi:MAG: HEAT repeat domain-containing protein [Methanoregula sp.]
MTTVESLKHSRDIRGLIRLLDDRNPDTQWKAADALGSLGEAACDPLLKILEFPKMHVRLGAIEALGDIRSHRSVEPVIRRLREDKDNEVRFVAALALGQIGDERALPALEDALKDPDRYVRYGAVMSLEMLSWTPDDEETLAHMLIAQQEWDTLHGMREAAAGPLITILKDPNPKTRQKIVELLGEIGNPEATKACKGALMDRDPGVRWRAVIACSKCGVPRHIIPQILASRPRTAPSAIGAAVLNLFFFGLGYNYIGKWWGFPVFMSYMTIMVFLQIYTGLWFPYIFVYPLTAISAVHTYYLVKRMPDM